MQEQFKPQETILPYDVVSLPSAGIYYPNKKNQTKLAKRPKIERVAGSSQRRRYECAQAGERKKRNSIMHRKRGCLHVPLSLSLRFCHLAVGHPDGTRGNLCISAAPARLQQFAERGEGEHSMLSLSKLLFQVVVANPRGGGI